MKDVDCDPTYDELAPLRAFKSFATSLRTDFLAALSSLLITIRAIFMSSLSGGGGGGGGAGPAAELLVPLLPLTGSPAQIGRAHV
jgi:hypothetical protein